MKKIIDLRENYHRCLKLQGCIFKDATVRSLRKICQLFLTMTYAKLQDSCFNTCDDLIVFLKKYHTYLMPVTYVKRRSYSIE